MSYAIKHALSEIVWSDGTGIDLPPISRSDNGWVYRPPEAQYPGSGKSFGKGQSGDREAEKWLSAQIQKAFEKRNWEIPANIPRTEKLPHINRNVVQVGWNHPVFGIVYIDLTYAPRSYYTPTSLKLTLNYNILAEDIADRQIRFHSSYDVSKSQVIAAPVDDAHRRGNPWSKDEINAWVFKNYEEFRRDPWSFTRRTLGLDPTVAELIGPHTELPDVDYSGNALTGDEEAWYRMEGNVDLLFEENAREYIIDNIKVVERLIFAFQHLGVEMGVSWDRFVYDEETTKARPTSVTFRVPPKEGIKGQEEEHTVIVDEKGISVKCGYVLNEERYLEYQQRHALNFFEEVFEEEWTTTETEL